VADDLHETGDRELAHVGDEVRALRLHVVSAETHDGQPGAERAKVPQQLAAIEIARGLAAGEEQAGLVLQAD
jgi:hypothetical protein